MNLSASRCLYASIISATARPNFTIFLRVACGRDGSVLLRRRCNTLCTSSSVNDVTFFYGPSGGLTLPQQRYCLPAASCTLSSLPLLGVGFVLS